MKRLLVLWLVLAVLASLAGSVVMAQDGEIPAAEIVNDEGGPVSIVGEYAYTDPNYADNGSELVVFLGDVSLLFDKEQFNSHTEYLNTDSPQVIGRLTSDLRESPFTYEIRLPIDPGAVLNDVDNDGEDDTGVMIFTVMQTFNGLGEPFIDQRELIYFSSMTYRRSDFGVTGGTFVVFAPEAGQGFPAGFGEDGTLFTDDDPIVIIPQGYTVVDLNTDPFTFDRSREGVVNIVESEPDFYNFSEMTYTEGFDALMDLLRTRYAFTEEKDLDWDALEAEFRPRVVEAEENEDEVAFNLAMRDFNWQIPDVHVSLFSLGVLYDLFIEDISSGLGMAIRELDDGRVLVNFVLEGGPAEEAGIELKAEILELNGQPIGDAISENVPWSAPFSTPEYGRLQQLRYVMRFPVGDEVEVTFQNPGDDEPTTATLTAIAEQDSFSFSSFNRGLTGFELPIEFEIMDNGYGYIKVFSFSDDNLLTLILWQRALRTFNNGGVTGIVVDMRQNSGGSSATQTAMLSSFFDEVTITGTSAFYDEISGEFVQDSTENRIVYPGDEIDRYRGDVAVIIGPACVSACEFFSYGMTLAAETQNIGVIGHYPTAGGGGSQQFVLMPGGYGAQYTEGRAVDPNGEIHIEGKGVQPTVHVPVTEESLFGEGDVLLDAAVGWLDETAAAAMAEVIDGGEVFIGDAIEGELAEGEAVRFSLAITPDDLFNIIVDAESDFVLRLYDETGETLYIEWTDPVLDELSTDEEEIILIEVETVGAFTLTIEAIE